MQQFSIQRTHGMRSRGRVCHLKMKPCLLSPPNLPHSFEVRGTRAVPSPGLCSPSGTGSLFGRRPQCPCSAPAHPSAVSRPLQALYLPSSQVGSSLFCYSLTFVEGTQLLKRLTLNKLLTNCIQKEQRAKNLYIFQIKIRLWIHLSL